MTDSLYSSIIWNYNQTIPANSYTDSRLNLINTTANIQNLLDNSSISRNGNCPAGYIVQNTTSSGVQCILDQTSAGTGNPFNQVLNTTSNVTFYNLSLTNLFVNGVNISKWVTNVSTNWTIGANSYTDAKITAVNSTGQLALAINSTAQQALTINTTTNIQNLINGTNMKFANVDFNNGWTNGGASIIGGNLFAQTVYVYNISSLNVNNLATNGSLFPAFDNSFDLGNSSFRWKNIFASGDIRINGTLYYGNAGIPIIALNDTAYADSRITAVNSTAQQALTINSTANIQALLTGTNISQYAYNQTIPANSYTDSRLNSINTTANIQNLVNSSYVFQGSNNNQTTLSCSNITGAASNLCTITSSGNPDFTNVAFTNQSNVFSGWQNFSVVNANSVLLNGVNISSWILNVSTNWTLNTFNNWNSTWDNRYLISSINTTLNIQNLYNSTIPQWFGNYLNSGTNASYLSTYNATYASYSSINTTLNIQNLYNVTASMIANLSISQYNTTLFNNAPWNESGTNVYLNNLGNNVGIGTISPTAKLQVVGSVAGGEVGINVNNTDPSGYAVIRVGGTGVAGTNGYLNLHAFSGGWASSATYRANGANVDGNGAGGLTISTSNVAGNISFLTGGTVAANERMIITQGGNVGIGTSSPTQKLAVVGNISFSDTSTLSTGALNYYTVGSQFVLQRASSSIRFKQNVTNISEAEIQKLLKLNPVTYQRKDTLKTEMGFIAEQVEKINPTWVVYDKLNMNDTEVVPFSVNYQDIAVTTTKLVQEQQKIIIQQNDTINLMKEELCKKNNSYSWC